jgi:hypothetical protein
MRTGESVTFRPPAESSGVRRHSTEGWIMESRKYDMRWEAVNAFGCVIVVAVLMGHFFGPFTAKKGLFFNGIRTESEFRILDAAGSPDNVAVQSQRQRVTLRADGSATLVSEVTYAISPGRRRVELALHGCDPNVTKIFDDVGRDLPFEAARGDDGAWVYEVALPAASGDGGSVHVQNRMEGLPLVRKQGENWTYSFRHYFGGRIRFEHTVTLPNGMVVVSARPTPSEQSTLDDTISLEFEKQLGDSEGFYCEVTYRPRSPSP